MITDEDDDELVLVEDQKLLFHMVLDAAEKSTKCPSATEQVGKAIECLRATVKSIKQNK